MNRRSFFALCAGLPVIGKMFKSGNLVEIGMWPDVDSRTMGRISLSFIPVKWRFNNDGTRVFEEVEIISAGHRKLVRL